MAFACISGTLGLAGVADCGCFGVIKASPWATFALDVGVLLGLVVARPDIETTRGWARRLGVPATLAGSTAGVLALLTLVAVLRYGSFGRAVGELRGERLTAPEYIDFGTCPPNQAREKSVTFQNLADHPVRLIGGTSDCSCLTTEGMPTEIPAGGEGSVTVTLSLPSSASGAFTRAVEIWVDDAGTQRSVRFRVGCRVDSSTLAK